MPRPVSILHLTREQADQLRRRVARDRAFYTALADRIRALNFFRDRPTYAANVAAGQVADRLDVLRGALVPAGTQPERVLGGPAVDPDDWRGEGI